MRLSEIAAHPFLSLDANDYLGEGDEVETGKDEIVVFALDRAGADAMASAAEVGLDGAPEEAVDADAGWRTLRIFQQTLRNDPDAELVVVAKGIRALDDLMSHDPDMVVIDESDGVGLITADAYRDLFALRKLLRDAVLPDDEGSSDEAKRQS